MNTKDRNELIEMIRSNQKGPRPKTREEVISKIEGFRSTLSERFADPMDRIKMLREYSKILEAILTAEEIADRTERSLEKARTLVGQKL